MFVCLFLRSGCCIVPVGHSIIHVSFVCVIYSNDQPQNNSSSDVLFVGTACLNIALFVGFVFSLCTRINRVCVCDF